MKRLDFFRFGLLQLSAILFVGLFLVLYLCVPYLLKGLESDNLFLRTSDYIEEVRSASVPAFHFVRDYLLQFFAMLAQINIGLAIFNLIPVPPLDGYRILNQFAFGGKLDQSLTPQTMMIIRYAFLMLCITGILSPALGKVIGSVFSFFLNLFWKIL